MHNLDVMMNAMIDNKDTDPITVQVELVRMTIDHLLSLYPEEEIQPPDFSTGSAKYDMEGRQGELLLGILIGTRLWAANHLTMRVMWMAWTWIVKVAADAAIG